MIKREGWLDGWLDGRLFVECRAWIDNFVNPLFRVFIVAVAQRNWGKRREWYNRSERARAVNIRDLEQ